jgi:hypothetical protein
LVRHIQGLTPLAINVGPFEAKCRQKSPRSVSSR